MKIGALVLSAVLLIVSIAEADTGALDWSLRAADQPSPSNRPWEQGANVSYQDVNGVSMTQSDAVLKGIYSWSQTIAAPLGQPPDSGGSIKYNISPGVYSHKSTSSSKPQNDRGFSFGVGGHVVPGGSGSGAVVDYDLGATITSGRTLKQGTGSQQNNFFDVQSDRQIISAVIYYQPRRGRVDPNVTKAGYFFLVSSNP